MCSFVFMLRGSGVYTSVLSRRLNVRIYSEVNGIEPCKGGG